MKVGTGRAVVIVGVAPGAEARACVARMAGAALDVGRLVSWDAGGPGRPPRLVVQLPVRKVPS